MKCPRYSSIPEQSVVLPSLKDSRASISSGPSTESAMQSRTFPDIGVDSTSYDVNLPRPRCRTAQWPTTIGWVPLSAKDRAFQKMENAYLERLSVSSSPSPLGTS